MSICPPVFSSFLSSEESEVEEFSAQSHPTKAVGRSHRPPHRLQEPLWVDDEMAGYISEQGKQQSEGGSAPGHRQRYSSLFLLGSTLS